ncbi:hypothetical protein [Halogeometricum limi]|uniref:Uncharacterized protein n=1 Tax=Halogeometricum limi TaxID=555875 RepID=A0A1I6HDG9_9EURY|nr:hypothetical protein [Halogeometricum limi]SFR52536.1 hypothetical protein SAMN04488124_2101 [Halogeometricum limi]
MHRRLFLFAGAVVSLGVVALFVGFGPPHEPSAVALTLSFLLAGLCFLVAGASASVSLGGRDVPWYLFAGVGDVALALGMAANGARIAAGGGTDDL